MENLELQEKIINLGKLLVQELGLEPGVDTFSRWMVHYVAEKMTIAEKLPAGKEKEGAEKECFDTILKLWKRRSDFPDGRRPFGNFETIFRVIEGLNPDRDRFFHQISEQELSNAQEDSEVNELLNGVLRVDKVARIWIEFLLRQAAMRARTEKAKAWLTQAVSISDEFDVRALRLMLEDVDSGSEHDATESSERKAKLQRRIGELEQFSNLNTFILSLYRAELSGDDKELA